MSLLREIQSAAIDDSKNVEVVLRMCRVLASRLKHEALKSWVQHELDGYMGVADEAVPAYRKMTGMCLGHFSGAFGSGIQNAPIPALKIPEEFRDSLTSVTLREGVAGLDQLIRSSKGNIRIAWPAEASMLFGSDIYPRYYLAQAWIVVPDSFVRSIMSTVRNRVLNFALEIEEQNPDAGEAAHNAIPIPKEKMSHIFNTHIYGNVGNVASGENIHQTATVVVKTGDLDALLKAFKEHDVGRADLAELKSAISVDPKSPGADGFGPKVAAWVGKMVGKAAEGSWKMTTTVAANLITSYLKSYYGM